MLAADPPRSHPWALHGQGATLETVRILHPRGAIFMHLDANVRGFSDGDSPCMKGPTSTLAKLGGCLEFDDHDPDIPSSALFVSTVVQFLNDNIAKIKGTLCVALSRPAVTALEIVNSRLEDKSIAVSMLFKPTCHVSMMTLWEQVVDLNDQVLALFEELGGGADAAPLAGDAVVRSFLQGIATEFKGTRNATTAADVLQEANGRFNGSVSDAAKSGHEGYVMLKGQVRGDYLRAPDGSAVIFVCVLTASFRPHSKSD